MCLVVIAFRSEADRPLVVAANRDEFHTRPTQDAAWWADASQVGGGRDLLAGGTWLAISRKGRFATVTNYRDAAPKRGRFRSRGHLVTDFLLGDDSPTAYLQSINGNEFDGFNLLVSNGTELGYLSNQGDDPMTLPDGVYGLANARLDSPSDKVTRSKARLESLLAAGEANDTELLRLLADRERAKVASVDRRGLPFEMAHAVTAPFIVGNEFGTRCSTIVTADEAGSWRLFERRFNSAGKPIGETTLTSADVEHG